MPVPRHPCPDLQHAHRCRKSSAQRANGRTAARRTAAVVRARAACITCRSGGRGAAALCAKHGLPGAVRWPVVGCNEVWSFEGASTQVIEQNQETDGVGSLVFSRHAQEQKRGLVRYEPVGFLNLPQHHLQAAAAALRTLHHFAPPTGTDAAQVESSGPLALHRRQWAHGNGDIVFHRRAAGPREHAFFEDGGFVGNQQVGRVEALLQEACMRPAPLPSRALVSAEATP